MDNNGFFITMHSFKSSLQKYCGFFYFMFLQFMFTISSTVLNITMTHVARPHRGGGWNGITHIVFMVICRYAWLLFLNMVSIKVMENLYSTYHVYKHPYLHQFLQYLKCFICELKCWLCKKNNKHLGSYYSERMHLDVWNFLTEIFHCLDRCRVHMCVQPENNVDLCDSISWEVPMIILK